MGLAEYQRKRDFHKTPEPRGKRRTRRERELSFVIQKHEASHLHYDFRLELGGVLKSWAVPKGPDLDPAHKRLAMQVEDHPLEYGGFEGIIPEGEYGGGTVMLWDKGVWEPVGDPEKGFRQGRLKFKLHGEKLNGGWMLVRRGSQSDEGSDRHWFLFKERDEFARSDEAIIDEMPLSVTTGRDLDEISKEADRTWGTNGEVAKPRQDRKRSRATTKKTASARSASSGRRRDENSRSKRGAGHQRVQTRLQALLKHRGTVRRQMPKAQSVELATLVEQLPSTDDWLHEIKFDGYRMLCRISNGKAHFISRNGQDWTKKFPELVEAAGRLPVEQAILDGEVVAMQPDGTTSFQALQNVFLNGRTSELVYYAFDVLHLNGRDVTAVPLEERKEMLRVVVSEDQDDAFRFSDHLRGPGENIMAHACRLHLEGIVSKRRGSLYRPGRGLDWLKTKCSRHEEFVIGGFTKPGGSRKHFGALLLGYYDKDMKLRYAGRVGTGFDHKTLAAVHGKLAKLIRPQSAFSDLSGSTGVARDVTWVKPVLVGQIRFTNWTDEKLLRHPAFLGLREDKPAKSVVFDHALSLEQANANANGAKSAQRNTTTSPRRRAIGRKSPMEPPSQTGFGDVRLSHPDKVLYPDQGITKRDLAGYYSHVAEWMLPHVIDRPLALVRCPGGNRAPCFFQKHPGEGASEYLRQVNISETGEAEYHVAIDDLNGLMSLVQIGALEIHVWGSRTRRLEQPDRLVFDLDPDPTVAWKDVVAAAREVRGVLDELDLTSFLKTTGGKGLHIVVPIQPRLAWVEAKSFCRSVADLMVRAAPDRYIATMSKAARMGKIFIDYLRNGRGATAIAPYSTRSRSGATVSVPIDWDELDSKLRPDRFTISSVPIRLKKLRNDPWVKMASTKQSITVAMRKHLAAL